MKILDIAFKDLVRSFRSLVAVGMMFVAPLLITGLIYFAFGGLSAGTGRFNLPPLTLVVVNQDEPVEGQPAFGRMLADYFSDPAMPEWLSVRVAGTETEARDAVNNREAGVALLIPTGFSKAVVANEGAAALSLVHDPTLTIGPQIVQDLVRLFMDGVTGTRIAITTAVDQAQARHVQVDAAAIQALGLQYGAWLADTERNIHHSAAPLLAVRSPAQTTGAPVDEIARVMGSVMAGMLIFFVFFGSANTAQSILREDEEGTLARLFTTPTSRTNILAGKFVAVFIIIGVQAVVLMSVSALAFKINWGQPASVVAVVFGVVVAAAGFGVCLVAFIKNFRQSGPIVGGVLAVTGMLGGLFTTGVAMPAAFQTLNLAMPQGWAYRGLKLALDGVGLPEVLLPTLVMVVIGAILFSIGAVTFRRRFA
jgi:ABC-2 type transport system permease protein